MLRFLQFRCPCHSLLTHCDCLIKLQFYPLQGIRKRGRAFVVKDMPEQVPAIEHAHWQSGVEWVQSGGRARAARRQVLADRIIAGSVEGGLTP